MTASETAVLALGSLMIVASALPIVRKNAWWIRICDFPRLQIAIVIALVLAVFVATSELSEAWHFVFAALLAASLAYQAFMMYPYTVLARRQVEPARRDSDEHTIGFLFANVEMENREAKLRKW